MNYLAKVLALSLLLVFSFNGALFGDTTLFKGDDFSVEIKGEKIVFTLTRSGVTKAAIPGYFNGWKPDAPEAQMQEKDGKYVLEVDLATFTKATPFEFKFHVNGDWDQGGNKSLNLGKKQGSWVFVESPVDAVKPNTKSSSDIAFHGRTSGLFRYAKNAIRNDLIKGDGDFYFDESYLDLDISMDFKVGTRIVGRAILNYNLNKYNSWRAGDVKNLFLDKYSTKISLDLLTIGFFYGERIVEFLNPTRGLDKFSKSYARNITFFKESAGEVGLFGRDYLGATMSMDLLGGVLQGIAARDRANDVYNTVMASRYYNNILFGKKFGIGASLVYEKRDSDPDRSGQQFMGYLNPDRMYPTYTTNQKWNEYQVGVDADFTVGPVTLFAEAKMIIYADDKISTNRTTFQDTVFSAGMKVALGSLKAEVQYRLIGREANAYSPSVPEDMQIAMIKLGFKNKVIDLKAQLSVYMMENSDSMLSAMFDGKVETSFFDLFGNISFVSQGEYLSSDVRLWVEWYLNSKLRLLAGQRSALYQDDTKAMRSYFMPYVGLGYKLDKNFNFKVYFGLSPEYSVYREDKGYVVDQYVGAQNLALDSNYLIKEKRMMENLAIQLEIDATF